MSSTFIEITADKFHEFIIENLPKHQTSESLITELSYQRFHSMTSFKKNFINEILNNYYGIHYVGIVNNSPKDNSLTYKLSVTDKKLCTFFLLKYAN
jgi:hypothetical protein